MKQFKTVCPLDCFDVCSMIATVEDGKVIKVQGNKDNPITKGYICSKGRAHLDRLYHPDRITKPMIKTTEGWREASYGEALNLIVDKMHHYIQTYGTQSLSNYNDCGYSGMSKSVEDMFFNHLGGVTTYRGTLCWGAGAQATLYDFGDRKGHAPEDLMHAKTVILWGRNPADNNIHFLEHLKHARNNGAKVILIDPIKTKTAQFCDQHVQINCSTDGHLAMAMAKVMINNKWHDPEFIEANVLGFNAYATYLQTLSLEMLSETCGVSIEMIKELAERYACQTPSAIWAGYGMQRYANGGNSIRAIDALGMITGMIGKSGGGVTYTHKSISKWIEGPVEASEQKAIYKRTYPKAKFADYMLNEKNPPVKMLFVTRANPMTQLPDINKVKEAFDQIEFKVVMDLFMTDTAQEADVFLPSTSIFEENEFIYSSMYNPYLQYSEKAVEPPKGMLNEYEVFRRLAKMMGLKEYPDVEQDQFLKMQLGSLCEKLNVSYEYCKKHDLALKDIAVPYKDFVFETPSGKLEIVSEKAKQAGASTHAVLLETTGHDPTYPLRLLTIRSPKSTNSQHFRDVHGLPTAYLSGKTATCYSVQDGSQMILESEKGQLKVRVEVNQTIPLNVIKVNQGWWHHSGCVNKLTGDSVTDMGEQAAYYDTFVRIVESKE